MCAQFSCATKNWSEGRCACPTFIVILGATFFYIPTSSREHCIHVAWATFHNYCCHKNGWGPNTNKQTGVSPDPLQFHYPEYIFMLSEADILVYWTFAQAADTFNACRFSSDVKSILCSACALVLYLYTYIYIYIYIYI